MVQNQEQPVGRTAFSIFITLSPSHCLDSLLRSAISTAYPLFRGDPGLNFARIGLITLVYRLSASVFQPITGIIFDKHPAAWSLLIGMSFTMIGIINLAPSNNLYWILVSVFLVGIGSSVLHPEASYVTFPASGGRRGLAQSLFQIGSNLGGSLGPLSVALLVTPYDREHLAVLTLFTSVTIGVMYPICKWYKPYLDRTKEQKAAVKRAVYLPLPMGKTALSIGILLILVSSKYICMANLTSYYTLYLIHKFDVTVQEPQLYLFIFLVATAIRTLLGGPIGDHVRRKYVIRAPILEAVPFSLLMPHATLAQTIILSFCIGLMLSSAFPAILLCAQELLPTKLGLISGLFLGFASGVADIASAILGNMADRFGIESVHNICTYMSLLGLVTFFLSNLKRQKIQI